jgi:hypothetical protein
VTPAAIVERIKSLALIGATSSTDNTKVYSYLNMAVKDVYEKVTSFCPVAAQEFQTVAITAGVGVLSPEPLHILGVRDADNDYNELTPTDISAVQEKDPGLDDEGAPDEYYQSGKTGLRLHPKNDTNAQVSFTPLPEEVDESSEEADFFLPSVFHSVYVWESLKLMAYDERDKIVGAELAYNDKACKELWDRIFAHYDAKYPQAVKHVESYLG